MKFNIGKIRIMCEALDFGITTRRMFKVSDVSANPAAPILSVNDFGLVWSGLVW
jgi:hypothetical protein